MNKNYQKVENLVTLTYNGKMIGFLLSSDVMVNATEMAKMFCNSKEEYMDKRPSRWLRTKEVQDYIIMLTNVHGVDISDIIITVRGGIGSKKTPGTWMNRRLAIMYAHWLDIQFGDWIYSKIEELIYNGQTIMNTIINPLQVENQQLRDQIAAQQPQIDYYNQVLNQSPGNTYSTRDLCVQLNLRVSARKFNDYLIDNGYAYRSKSGKLYLKSPYCNDGLLTTVYEMCNDGVVRPHVKWTESGKQWIWSRAIDFKLI